MSFKTAAPNQSPAHIGTFNNFEYKRPDLDIFENLFRKALENLLTSKSFADCEDAIDTINNLRAEVDTMQSLALIRYNANTQDAFYTAEAHYFDTHYPLYQNIILEFYKLLRVSPYKNKIQKKWGPSIFSYIDAALLTSSPLIIENLKVENQLSSQYNKLIASAKINFEGAQRNIADIQVFEQDTDRNKRKIAAEAKWNFFASHAEKLDTLYSQLVKVRHETAQSLGLNNFIDLAYLRFSRTDYKQEHVALFRNQIKKFVVPIVNEIYKKRALRLNLDKIKYYDTGISFKTGNAKVKGDFNWLLNTADNMFSQLSPETDMFFKFMRNKELMDLVSRKDKSYRGYCTWLNKYKAPFIFANFNGTSNDVRILIHELGHAFQKYHSKHFKLPEYNRPTLEACEINSMGLEFLTWPWMNLFFGEDTTKYQYSHMCSALVLLTYCAAIDEFQHVIYARPDLSAQERKNEWKKIEAIYLPYHDYDDNGFLNTGAYWQHQAHVFTKPFYYIDYALAQICALQFWNRANVNFDDAWQDYLKICKVGGSLTFSEILKLGNLKSPFESNCLEVTIKPVVEWLNCIDDVKL